jgi:hypothetical protein
MNLKEKIAFGAVLAFALSSGGFAIAQSNSVSSDQVIYACVTPVNAAIFKVSNVPHTCPKNTTAISWNVAGVKGDQGIQGTKGDTGFQGLNGSTGTQGPQGLTGPQGPKGDAGATGQKGDQGLSAPITYAVSGSGEKYAILTGPFGGSFINIGGYLYSVDGYRGNAPALTGFYTWGPGFGYTSSNCSGTEYYLATSDEYIQEKFAYQDPTVTHFNNPDTSDLFSFEKITSVQSSSIRSFYRQGVGCTTDPFWANWGLTTIYLAKDISRPQIVNFTW